MFSSVLILLLLVICSIFPISLQQQQHHHHQHDAPPNQPNILFILTDDQDLLLNSLDFMPKLKKYMGVEGVSFANYFIPTPLCAPSRASILRGQYAHNTHIIDLSLPGGGAIKFHNLGEDNHTVGTWMRNAGYTTAFHGKYMNEYPCQTLGHKPPAGWDDWFALCDPGVYNYYNSIYSNNGVIEHHPDEYQTETLGIRSADFITKAVKSNKPFFVHLSGCAPHQPATPAKKYANLFSNVKAPRRPSYNQTDVSLMPSFVKDLPAITQNIEDHLDELYRNRLRALQSVDDNVEMLVTLLDKLGALNNTYIFYTADNGFHLGEHRMTWGKREPFETDVRVPLFVRGPGVPKNTTLTLNAANIDLAPTFVDLAKGEIPSFVDGKSVAKFLTKPSTKQEQDDFRPFVYFEHFGESSGVDGEPVYLNNTWQSIKLVNRTSNMRYSSWCTNDHEVYNLAQDPDEMKNTYNAHTTWAESMDKILRHYFACANTSCHNNANLNGHSAGVDLVPLTSCYVNAK